MTKQIKVIIDNIRRANDKKFIDEICNNILESLNDWEKEATKILKDLGLNMSTAINVFLKQVVERDGLPFAVSKKQPSKQLLEALEEAEYIEKHPDEYKSYHDVDEMLEDILKDD